MTTEDKRRRIRDEEQRLLAPVVRRIIPPSARILEIGCGLGHETRWLSTIGWTVGTDPFARVVGGGDLTFVKCGAERLPFAGRSFDLVFSSSVIEHIPDLEAAFGEMKRVLRPAGAMLHVVPTAAWKALSIIGHYGALARSSVRRMLGKRRPLVSTPARSPTSVSWRGAGGVAGTSRWIPQVHGTAPTNRRELQLFMRGAWVSAFESHGLQVEQVIPLLLYSPPEFALIPPVRSAAMLGITSTIGFVLRPSA